MVDIRINATTNDIDITNNRLSFVRGDADEVRQRLQTALGIFLGEWFANELFGLPYIQQFMTRNGKSRNLQTLIDNTVRNYVLNLSYIARVESLTSEITNDRVYQLRMVITARSGATVTLSNFQFTLEV